ncbi:MAG: hypothetical protein KAS87_05325 [Candidatus Omnitrophica bacterium]|nr:hypothetical protein [Candidatus Omnitrophota bacterium]
MKLQVGKSYFLDEHEGHVLYLKILDDDEFNNVMFGIVTSDNVERASEDKFSEIIYKSGLHLPVQESNRDLNPLNTNNEDNKDYIEWKIKQMKEFIDNGMKGNF